MFKSKRLFHNAEELTNDRWNSEMKIDLRVDDGTLRVFISLLDDDHVDRKEERKSVQKRSLLLLCSNHSLTAYMYIECPPILH